MDEVQPPMNTPLPPLALWATLALAACAAPAHHYAAAARHLPEPSAAG